MTSMSRGNLPLSFLLDRDAPTADVSAFAAMLSHFPMRLSCAGCHTDRLFCCPEYAYFFFYSFVRTSYIKRLAARLPKGAKPPPLSTAAELILGAIAGALAQIFTIPVSVIATRQQIGPSLDGRRRRSARATPERKAADIDSAAAAAGPQESDDSFLGVAKEIVEEEGIGGLWLGIKPGLVLTVNPAITYGAYERVKSVLLVAQEKATGVADAKLSAWTAFAVGALSKTLATVVRILLFRDWCGC